MKTNLTYDELLAKKTHLESRIIGEMEKPKPEFPEIIRLQWLLIEIIKMLEKKENENETEK